jgi:Fe2+ or Zn2+ uptake regulation protein
MSFANEIMIKGTTRYDSNTEMHINLICENCSRVRDIEDPEMINHLDRISKKVGYTIKGKRADVYGTCSLCKNVE